MAEPLKRWKATIRYNRGKGHLETETYMIDELTELPDIVERGETYYNVYDINIVLNPENIEAMGYLPIPGHEAALVDAIAAVKV